jgi:hypothetical protein
MVNLEWQWQLSSRCSISCQLTLYGFSSGIRKYSLRSMCLLKEYRFNAWLDYKFTKTPRNSLIVYPEAHRMYAAK